MSLFLPIFWSKCCRIQWSIEMNGNIGTKQVKCNALHDLVAFIQFKKREKHPWRSVNFSKVAGWKLTLLHGCFSRFLNGTNGTKSRNEPQIIPYNLQSISWPAIYHIIAVSLFRIYIVLHISDIVQATYREDEDKEYCLQLQL